MTVLTNRGVQEDLFIERRSGTGNVLLPRVLGGQLVTSVPNAPLQDTTEGYIVHHLSRSSVQLPEVRTAPGLTSGEVSLFMQALHGAFSEHIPFSLSPEMAWYLIAHEIAVHIKLNQDRYRGYFTASWENETIIVRDDSLVYGSANQWGRSINLIRDPMAAMVPQPTIDLMLPQFTTSTFETDTALLVLFLDMVSNYYKIKYVTRCGIPSIRIEGNYADWLTVVGHAEQAQREFPDLRSYFSDLLPILGQLADLVEGREPDPEFVSSIYKYNDRSGTAIINGWITAFFAHKMSAGGFHPRSDLNWRQNVRNGEGFSSDQFPVHLTAVPYVWDYFGTDINMAFIAGVMGVEYDGYLNPRLGYGVLEDKQGKLARA